MARTETDIIPSAPLARCGPIAVTGGLGFVGRHLVRALAQLRKSVTVLDLAPPPDDGAPLPCVTYRRIDIRDPRLTAEGLRGAELVFHLAGNSSGTLSIDRPRFDFETNAYGTFNVCEALAAAGSGRLVYLSSAMVYGTPRTCPVDEQHPLGPFLPYGASKLSGEHTVAAFHHAMGLQATIARAFTLYGPGEHPRRAGGEVSQFLRWHLNRRPIHVTGDPDRKTRDFCHVRDLVGALLLIADRGTDGEAYNVGSGTETSLRELARAVGEVTGRPPRLRCDDSVSDDSYRMVADVSKLRELGYRPQVTLRSGLRELVTALGDRPALPAVDTIFRRDQRGAPPMARASS